ncbi:MAG: amidohydrolase [Synergistes sp.]|nr:amidohydrolase [Synergistes sp.]
MKEISKVLDEKWGKIAELEQFLYENPEIERQEYKAKEKFLELLTSERFEIFSEVKNLPTAFAACKKNGEGPSIAIMAEYDALPGLGHGCGHNLIGAMSFGTAAVLGEMLGDVNGIVWLLGSPAEETGWGKPGLIDDGWLKKADVAMMMHPAKFTGLVSSLVNLEGYDITFHGSPSHAADAPESGVNALDAAVLFYNSISMLRQQTPDGTRLQMIFTDGGSAVNIIPDKASIRLEARHSDAKYFRTLIEKVHKLAHAAAEATFCTVDIEMFEPPIASMNCNPTLTKLFKNHLIEEGETDFTENFFSGGCTDMGNVSWVVPAIHPWVKMVADNVDGHTREFLKQVHEPYAFETMRKYIKCLAGVGLDILKTPELVKEIKEDFRKSL